MKCTAQDLFIRAFKAAFGKSRRGIIREARCAYGRWKNRGSLTARARRAITAFLAGLMHLNGSPVTA